MINITCNAIYKAKHTDRQNKFHRKSKVLQSIIKYMNVRNIQIHIEFSEIFRDIMI